MIEGKVSKFWPLFTVIVAISWIVNSSLDNSWASGAGYVSVFAFLGLALVKTAKTASGITGAYIAFLIISGGMSFGNFESVKSDVTEDFMMGCTRVGGEKEECSCVARDVAPRLVFKTSIAFAKFEEPTPISEDPNLQGVIFKAWEICSNNPTS